jgi:hypothetical protein
VEANIIIAERKVIQIAPMVVPGMDNMSSPHAEIIVLCDDGTMWRGDGSGWWEQLSGPEHLPKLANALTVRRRLESELDKETSEKVKLILRSGGML